MTDRVPKVLVFAAAAALGLPFLAYVVYTRPGYFTNTNYVGGLVLLECMVGAVCLYRQVFFPVVMVTFLMAGSNLPFGGGSWTAVRWVALCVGAAVGSFIMLQERRHRFGLFHAVAVFAVISAIVSAAVSRYHGLALLKALSLLLLFLYTSTGTRIAMTGRENRFFHGLLSSIEIFVALMAAFYLLGMEAMGNPNSLGAVMGVVCAPILLWGTLLDEGSFAHRRRLILYALSMYLVFHSHSRAGLAAAFVSCAILCLALRQYKLLGQGMVILLIIVAATAIFNPEVFSRAVSSFHSDVLYKGQDPTLGVFASRQTPWQRATQSIRGHFWFGSGFGTTDNGQDASAQLSQYHAVSTNEIATSENGSSYLSIVSWVGVLGVVPFALLVLAVLGNVFRTIGWMIRTANPGHPAIPLAMVMVAGLVHAGFEDWLFAVGYYLCVFYWALAFVLADIVPRVPSAQFSWSWRPKLIPQTWPRTAQSQ